MPSSPVLMDASLSVVIFWLMHPLHESCCGREEQTSELPKSRIRQVYEPIIGDLTLMKTDCPEREATYIITNGGINDPEKV